MKSSGIPWIPAEVKSLRSMAAAHRSVRYISKKLGRTEEAIRVKLDQLNIDLKSNKTPVAQKLSEVEDVRYLQGLGHEVIPIVAGYKINGRIRSAEAMRDMAESNRHYSRVLGS